MSKSNVRVRIAPSPTGEVHIGTIWMALFNWIYAKKHGGKFILRIEDTDRNRFVEGSAERIYEALEWIGITPDEGPQQGGSKGPYIQSQRLELYQKYAKQLIESGHAYHCFCPPERLEEMRAAQQAAKLPPRYDKHCLSLPAEEVKQRLAAGESSVVRLNIPTTGTVTHHDLIRGDVTFRYDLIDDSVLLKSDGYPTYHLAVIVDDHLMEINPVIRAEEWLPSIPKHLYLYQCLGWEPPEFAHLPLILGTDRSKMSKRDGATSALSYRDAGYLPEAMQNFLILMGWHPGGDNEIVTLKDIIAQFELKDINPSGAIFDRTKLDWFNGYYIRQLDESDLLKRLKPFWKLPKSLADDSFWQLNALHLVKDRLHILGDIKTATDFLIPEEWVRQLDVITDHTMFVPKKGTMSATITALAWLREEITKLTTLNDASEIKTVIIKRIAEDKLKNGDILWPGRVALSLSAASPDIFDIMYTLGKDEVIRRLEQASNFLNKA